MQKPSLFTQSHNNYICIHQLANVAEWVTWFVAHSALFRPRCLFYQV